MADAAPVHLDDVVSLKEGKDSAHEQMLAVCRKALPGWGQLAAADVEVRADVLMGHPGGSIVVPVADREAGHFTSRCCCSSQPSVAASAMSMPS